MSERLTRWQEQDRESFSRIKKRWHRTLHNDTSLNPDIEICGSLNKENWQQDKFGNWILSFPSIYIHDEDGNKLDYQIAVCNDILPSQHPSLINQLTNIAIGKNTNCEFVGHGTRSWAGKINYGGTELICLYMNEVDITGIERLSHMNLLSIALEENEKLGIPKPIFATTNFFIAPLITSKHNIDLTSINEAENKLNTIREKLLINQWNPKVHIDSNPSNYRRIESGMIYNIDPVFRRSMFVFG